MEYRFIKVYGKNSRFKYAMVDPEDFERCLQYKWYLRVDKTQEGKINQRKYAIAYHYDKNINKKVFLSMHQFVFGKKEQLVIDHINHDGLDNRKDNLRHCTDGQNQMNSLPREGTSSPYKGVAWHNSAKRWTAMIQCNYKPYHLGFYNTEEDAAHSYDYHAIMYFGEYAYLNYPEFDYINYEPNPYKPNPVSKYYGVSQSKDSCNKSWRARTTRTENGKRKDVIIGYYETEIEAAKARDKYMVENNLLGRHGVRPLNFPKDYE